MGYDLSGKSVVVTGATSGIGLAVARQMAEAGAFVIGVGRSAERNARAEAAVRAVAIGAQAVFLLTDLASQTQVRGLAKAITRTLAVAGFEGLDALVNNAGVYMIPKVMTEDGIEMTFAVDHLAGFLLTHELLDPLRRAKGRVLTTSSYSHRTTPLCLGRIANPWPYVGLVAYKRVKLCNVLFTYELNRRYPELTAFAVDPGLVNTEITTKGGRGIEAWIWERKKVQGTTADVPARTYMYLVGEQQVDVSQGYYFKDSAPLAPSPQSQRVRPAERLWALSCALTGVRW
ncbi:SDR family NAD(P)-dependent oxidoreductase [bacterium]|nr:SDR family NAD(P)-dependent oxidoreductase [bacterium]